MDEIVLPASTETFGFRFTDFDYQNANPMFQYRLFPYDDLWSVSNNGPIANYYKVPSGKYTFQVRSTRSGMIQNQMHEISLIILPPWWRTWWAYALYIVIFALGVYLVHRVQSARVIRKERDRTKDRELVQAKEIEKAYEKLKSTQNQLIHSEKMASLGELTAGIAHEIQNPLNFVNNFSEVNKELIDELKEAQVKGHKDEIDAITKDILENEDKIMHHGKRAEAIVKSMLQHSRTSTGEKEPTDINALADEYLRLAYHGFRAKDKSFNAQYNTDFDPKLPRIKVVSQDIGRVILNLVTNAFHAVSKKREQEVKNYQPTVIIQTRDFEKSIEVIVTDNGGGIPNAIKDKIFQPFFTTKASGEGTGLGLSMSYDIITKGHSGQLTVESKEGEGSTFTILLPKT